MSKLGHVKCAKFNIEFDVWHLTFNVYNRESTFLECHPKWLDDKKDEGHRNKTSFHKVRSLLCCRLTFFHKPDDVRQALQTSSKWWVIRKINLPNLTLWTLQIECNWSDLSEQVLIDFSLDFIYKVKIILDHVCADCNIIANCNIIVLNGDDEL